MHAYLTKATTILREVSKILLRAYDNPEKTPAKQKEQLQKTREKLEAKIYKELQGAYPRHEFTFPGIVTKNIYDTIWYINVLSGETNFCHGIPHFAMVMTIRDQGKVQHSLVFDPISQEIFTATQSDNTQLNRKNIRVGAQTELAEAIVGSNFNLDQPHARRTGCPALELAYVACGRFDGFVGKDVNNYDLTAGSLLVKSAGGLIGDWQGGNQIEETGQIVASNKKLFKQLLKSL